MEISATVKWNCWLSKDCSIFWWYPCQITRGDYLGNFRCDYYAGHLLRLTLSSHTMAVLTPPAVQPQTDGLANLTIIFITAEGYFQKCHNWRHWGSGGLVLKRWLWLDRVELQYSADCTEAFDWSGQIDLQCVKPRRDNEVGTGCTHLVWFGIRLMGLIGLAG